MDWFAEYAKVLLDLYSDRVKTWFTINEPMTVCDCVYGAMEAPYLIDPEFGAYLCNRHVLLGHAKVWRMYDEHYRPKYPGE